MSESEIPGPVLIEGMRVAGNVFNAYCDDDGRLGLEAPGVIVARAILAERERCADLVEALAEASEAQSAWAVLSEAVSAIRSPIPMNQEEKA